MRNISVLHDILHTSYEILSFLHLKMLAMAILAARCEALRRHESYNNQEDACQDQSGAGNVDREAEKAVEGLRISWW